MHHSLPLYVTLEQLQIGAETHLTILNEVQRQIYTELTIVILVGSYTFSRKSQLTHYPP